MKPPYIYYVLLIGPLSGCITMSNLPAAEAVAPPSSDETIVVLGVHPRYRVAISKGTTDDTNWSLDQLSFVTTNSFPKNGYVVVKVPSRTGRNSYGISQILPEGIGANVSRFVPCTGDRILAFEAPKGKVVYVGDVSYTRTRDKLRFTYSWRPDEAKRFVESQYHALSPWLEPLQANILTVDNISCGPKTIVVPITVKTK